MCKPYYYTSLFHHSVLLFHFVNKRRSMLSSMLITQCSRQLKVKLQQNLYSAPTDIKEEPRIQKTGLLQENISFHNRIHKLKV